MTVLAGLTLFYVVPSLIAALFWVSPWFIRRLINTWVGRDVMLSLIPEARHVHHTERILGVVRRRLR